MDTKALVSIITPSFNTGPYIDSTLKSVASQDYPNIEHIVFDGGSTDETLEILAKYPNVAWVSEKDKGQSDAINKGFSKAKGKYIGWLNSDDTYSEGAVSKAVEYLEKNPDVDMIYTDLNIIDEKDTVYGFTKGLEFNLRNLLENNPVKQPTFLMRREVIDKLKGVDESLHFVMDRELWLRMLINGFKIKYISGWIHANFRLVKGTKTFEYTPKFRQEWYEVMKQAFSKEAYFKGIDSQELKRALRVNRSDYYLSLMNMDYASKKSIKGFVNGIKVIQVNPAILLNRGFYKQFLLGFLGINLDRTEKFKL